MLGFLLNVQEIYRKKCPETALKRRLEAEACLKIGDKKKALNLYSQCILKAPSTGGSYLSPCLFDCVQIFRREFSFGSPGTCKVVDDNERIRQQLDRSPVVPQKKNSKSI